MDKYQVFIDGASKGNPGHAGMGIVIQDPDGEVLHQIGEYIGILTNNQAEYSALIKALEKLKQLSAKEAKIFSDSELLVRQWNGEYQVKDPKIRELFFKAKNISSNINLNVVHIKREKNFLADKIATEAVKAHGKSKDRQQDISVNINKSDLDESNEEIQVSAGGIVYKKEGSNIKVCLIAKKKKSVWVLPKGRVLPEEDPVETAKREIKEETGYEADVKEKIDELEYYFHLKEKNISFHKYVYFYLMPVKSDVVHERDQEADEVKWFTVGDAISKLTYLDEKEVMKKAKSIFNA